MLDISIIVGVCTLILAFVLGLIYIKSKKKTIDEPKQQQHPQQRPQDRIQRRANLLRNRGNRLRAAQLENVPQNNNINQNDDDDNDDSNKNEKNSLSNLNDNKIGAKKRAKLEAKAEKKAQREAEELQRNEKRKREQQAEEERRKVEENELLEEKKRLEEERKAKEELEKREYEEYLKMKEAFSIEQEGYDEDDDNEKENLLQEFVNYIKQEKVVVIEDLAAKFKLKTQATIERIKDLQNDDILTGVIDDRGKFIFVSNEEMKAVAKFIRQRGRVSINELAENSNKLINLTPIKTFN